MKLPLVALFILAGMFGVPAADLVTDSARLARAQAGRNELRPAASARAGESRRRAEAAAGSETTTDSAREATDEGVQVTAWRFISTKELTRVMLDLSRKAKFDVRRLKEDPAQRLPARIYIDIIGARLALASNEPLAVDDEALRQVRIGQHGSDSVRVVLDMNELRAHNVFLSADPTRLVIDIAGRAASGKLPAKEVSAKTVSAAPRPTAQARKAEAPAPASGLRKIVLDPGHGGKDPGAIGVGGVAEKDLVLGVAKKLARKLHAELGVKVVLTRNDDRYVPLEDRTALANS